MPDSRATRSRIAYMSRNFQVVSTCSSGKGGGAGWKALRARCSMTALSLPIEYSITGRSASATTSRRMWMLSASRRWRCVSGAGGTVIGREAVALSKAPSTESIFMALEYPRNAGAPMPARRVARSCGEGSGTRAG